MVARTLKPIFPFTKMIEMFANITAFQKDTYTKYYSLSRETFFTFTILLKILLIYLIIIHKIDIYYNYSK